tara:strand:+ start:4498 stop:5454 length:957 start_codon:yes stop_codon:yes gene_type:complete
MNIKKPIFWDKKEPSFLSYILYPATFFIKINNIFFKYFPKKKFNKIKSICVGNIYLGGTGKTPTTLKLYQILKAKNYDVVIGKKYYSNQKDEQDLLKNKAKFISSTNREKIIKLAIKNRHKVIIFDDGLQDKKIEYDLKLVCFDSKIWLGNSRLIPSGPLREDINSLKKYNGVFLKISDNKTELIEIISEIKKTNSKIEIFKSFVHIKNINQFNPSDKYLIFSGIGNASSFKEILNYNKFKIVEEKIFSDHYNYKNEDISKILEISKNKGLKILTTEKDYFKIPSHFRNQINFLEIDLKFDEEEKLLKLVESKINEKN